MLSSVLHSRTNAEKKKKNKTVNGDSEKSAFEDG